MTQMNTADSIDCKSLIDSLPCGIAEFDLNGKIIFCNSRLEKMHECPVGSSLMGMHIVDLLPDQCCKDSFKRFLDTINNGEKVFSGYYDSTNITMAGNLIDVRIQWDYKYDLENNHVGYVAVITDIGDYKKACNDLKISDLRFRNLFDSMLDGIALFRIDPASDSAFTLLEMNKFFQSHFDLCRTDALDKEMGTIFDKPISELFINSAQKVLSTSESICIDDFFNKNRYLNILFFIPEENHLAVITKDNTKNRHLSEQLFQSQKMEALGTLAGGMAHDFNNVLTTILGFTEILKISLKDNKYHVKRLDKIKNAAKKASSLVKQLLAVSRRQPIEQRDVDVNKIVLGMVEVLEPLMGENIDHVLDLCPDLFCVKADQSHFEQMILNLTVNARDAMPKGGIIKFRTFNIFPHALDSLEKNRLPAVGSDNFNKDHNFNKDLNKNFVCFEFSDTGTGIAPEDLRRIFDPFYTTKKTGTGLGLSVIYGIVTQHGGTIEVVSTPQAGTTFRIIFPASNTSVCDIAEDTAGISIRTKGSGQTILVVEDNEGIKDFLTLALGDMGYNVESASNGYEARKVFDNYNIMNKNIDLLFSDVILPDVDGIELADELRSIAPDIKVLMCSGYGNDGSSNRQGKKSYSFIKKPFELLDVMEAIKSCLNEK